MITIYNILFICDHGVGPYLRWGLLGSDVVDQKQPHLIFCCSSYQEQQHLYNHHANA